MVFKLFGKTTEDSMKRVCVGACKPHYRQNGKTSNYITIGQYYSPTSSSSGYKESEKFYNDFLVKVK